MDKFLINNKKNETNISKNEISKKRKFEEEPNANLNKEELEEKDEMPLNKKLKDEEKESDIYSICDKLKIDASQELKNIEERFESIANFLLNKAVLMIQGQKHRFVEIEFYFNSECFPDPYPHGDVVQQHCGRWYFHKTGTSYRNG